ncbi:putative DNA repair protein RadC [Peribacillus simplex]|uniref:DNA repair protein RadC n=1 Tax=Peribacillus simplex TaxID=1478 RepID=A0AAN2PC62_9BACI|nr:putative DNA repair protein RadC [Peribacillus simplex]
MELTPIFEVVRIKQEIREMVEPFAAFQIRNPEDARELAAAQIANEDREVFLVMMLNTKNHVVGLHRAHVGSLNASVVHPRDVLKCAILNNAASLIVSHQHHRVTQPRVWKTLKSQSDWRKQGKLLGLKF